MHICGEEIMAAVAVCSLCLRLGFRVAATYVLNKFQRKVQ